MLVGGSWRFVDDTAECRKRNDTKRQVVVVVLLLIVFAEVHVDSLIGLRFPCPAERGNEAVRCRERRSILTSRDGDKFVHPNSWQ